MSNRIDIIRGTSLARTIDLVDENNEPLLLSVLKEATGAFEVQANPEAGTPVILLSTSDEPASLTFKQDRPAIDLVLSPDDTTNLEIRTYFYRLRVTLADGTVTDAIPWSPFDVNLGGSAAVPPPPFENTVKLDHDYQLPNDLQYVTDGGSPIEDAQVRVYLKSDYDAGNLAAPIGVTRTDAGGKWRDAILVNPGYSYVVRFDKPGEYGPDTRETFA